MISDCLRVLVIEDNPGDARLVREAVSQNPAVDLEHAERLEDGLSRLAGGGVDVVLLDLGLPDAQGLEGLTMLQLHAPKVPVVVLTGSDTDHLGRAAVKAGAQDFLVKGELVTDSLVRCLRYAVERQQLHTGLQAANADLHTTNLAMRDFVAIAAHDLRSPLVAVSGFARLLTERWATLTEEQRRSMATTIDRNARNLGHFVDDLLTLSTIEGAALRARPQAIQVNDAIGHCLERSDTAVEVSCPPELAVVADPNHLTRILDNYLTNAFKYGAPPVQVGAHRDGNMVEIHVRDHGPGVPLEFVSRLFTKFTRADTPQVSTQQGSGLGLSIVRGLAEANAGQAYYTPNASTSGAAFVLRLPERPRRPVPDRV